MKVCTSAHHNAHPVMHSEDECPICEIIDTYEKKLITVAEIVKDFGGWAVTGELEAHTPNADVGTGDNDNGGDDDASEPRPLDEPDSVKRARAKEVACADIGTLSPEAQELILTKHKIKRRKDGDSVVDAIMSWRGGLEPCLELSKSLEIALSVAVRPTPKPEAEPPTGDVDGPVVDEGSDDAEAGEPDDDDVPF